MSNSDPEIAIIGGGTGSYTILNDLKEFTPNISAIVNMSDDGGSTGKLREELGVMPPGDIRQCLVALSDPSPIREAFNYRFAEGPTLGGHSLGNLIIAALEQDHHDISKAIKLAGAILDIIGRVVPVTTEVHDLIMTDGEEHIRGEYIIGHRAIVNPDARVALDPPATINPEARLAIEEAELVVIAPGNLYGSLLPALSVNGVAEAIQASRGKKVMVSNLVTKPGQTDGWHVADFVKEVEKYVGPGAIDVALYNTEPPSLDLLSRYAADGEHPIGSSIDKFKEISAEPVGANLLNLEVAEQHQNDTLLRRTRIRHDGHKVSRELMKIYYK